MLVHQVCSSRRYYALVRPFNAPVVLGVAREVLLNYATAVNALDSCRMILLYFVRVVRRRLMVNG